MKTLVWIIFLIVVVLLSTTTIEGATSTPTYINIRQPKYSLTFIRPITYNYRYPFEPILQSPPDGYISPSTILYKYHFGIIIPTGQSKKKHDNYFDTMNKNLKSNGKKTILSKTIIYTDKDFSKFIENTKVTDVWVIMRYYDLVEAAYKQYTDPSKPISFSVQEAATIPVRTSANKNDTHYIKRAINYPALS